MKRFLSLFLALIVAVGICLSAPMTIDASAADARVEKAIEWAVAVANNNYHGYSQTNRYGNPDYDCSSFVSTAFNQAGFNVACSLNTRTMKDAFMNAGFTWIPASSISGFPSKSTNLQRGDILLKIGSHTELYIGSGKNTGAHMDYNKASGGYDNGVGTFSSGYNAYRYGPDEIDVCSYWNDNWDGVLRYTGTTPPPTPTYNPELNPATITQGQYYLKSKSGGYLTAASDANGANVYTKSQQDDKCKVRITANSYAYEMRVFKVSETRVVNAYADAPKVGTKVTLYKHSGSTSQSWIFQKQSDGYIIRCKYNPNLIVTNNGGSVATLQTYTGANNQIWYLESAVEKYTISYNANGGSGAPSSQTKTHGTNLTLSTTKPTKTGYTFKGWGTSASDTTVDYAPGATYTANSNVTLYAIWSPNAYNVSYNANGGWNAPSSQTKYHDQNLTLSTTKPTRTGYNFMGWGTSTGDTSVNYEPGATYSSNANITLYAIWSPNAYSVSYDANGGSGCPSSQTKYHNTTLTLSSTVPTRDGYKFVNWYSTATDEYYNPGDPYYGNVSTTMQARWEEKTSPIYYRSSQAGTTNLPEEQTKVYGQDLVLSTQIPVCPGYTFLYWKATNGSKLNYNPGDIYTYPTGTILVAQWKCNHTLNGTTIVNAKDPTYTEEGYTGDTKCNTCEEIIKTGSAISKVVLGVPAVKATNTTNGVNLTWNAIDGATSYKIFRKKLTGTTWTAWSSPANGITITSYLDKTAKLGETYIYAVSAVNSSVTGSFRQTDAIKCNMTPTVSVANSENYIKVSWNAINGAESYTVFRRAYNESTKTWGGWSKLKEGYTSTSYNDTLGNLGVTYSYAVVAVNSTLSSNYVSSVSVKCTPTLKPTIKNTTDGIKVEWGKIFGATSYKVFRRELDTSNNTWSGWASVTTGYTGNAFVDKTAKLGVTYSYAVVGVNNTTSSNYVATSGLKCDIPVTVKVTSTTSGINLTWNKVNGATGYTIYRKAFNATNNTWSSWSVLKTGYTGTSYTDTLGNLGASYIYCVRATVGSFSGSYVQSSSVKCNVVPKTTINNTTNGIKVSWSNVFGATSYKIFRRELNTTNNTWGSWAVIASGVTGSACIDKTAKLGVTYSYAVVAVNSTTSSSYIATSGLKCDPTPTVSVSNTQTGVSVKWNAINGAESYIVYRRAYDDSTKTWGKWSQLKKDYKSTSYVDSLGNLGTTYNYTVRAVANGEKGSYVSSVSIKCNIPPKVTIANTSTGVKVSWSNVFGATSYKVFRRELNTANNTWSGWMSPASGLTGSAYIDTTAKLGVTYSYAVVASNSTTSSSYVATSGLKCNMAPTVKIANATNGVKITWNAINGAGSYKIYRKELNTVNNTWSGWMSPASGVTGTSYVDKTAKLGVTYIYTVAAVGNGITSNFVATSALKFDPIPTVTIGTATNGIRVNWNAINGADSYIIYKKTYNAKTGKWSAWTTVAQNYKGTTVVDTSAVNGTYYMYTVRATKGTFNSSFTQSNVVKYVK